MSLVVGPVCLFHAVWCLQVQPITQPVTTWSKWCCNPRWWRLERWERLELFIWFL